MEDSFAQCQWPIWRVDDLTPCFKNHYLKVIFPLIVVGLSLLQIFSHNIRRAIKSKRNAGYQPISDSHPNTAEEHTAIPPDEEVGDDDDDDLPEINGGRLALVKTTTKGSVVQADNPPAERIFVVVELLAIAGLIAVNAALLVTGAAGSSTRFGSVVGVLVWLYVLILASLRLFLGNTKWRVPRLWNHTATIYSVQWLFSIVFFRSAFIHPRSQLAQILTFVEFGLASLLFFMTVNTRKGNKTVLLEWENGVEPSREPLASLFSLATFTWVDPIIWNGYKNVTEISNVWNLLPKDKAAAVLADYRTMKRTTSLAIHLLKYFKGPLIYQSFMAAISGALTFAPTLLLKAILEYVEHPDSAPINVLWLYVILLPLVDVVRSVADGIALWIGRKICIRIRAIIVGEIYAKALRRKAATTKDTVLGDEKKPKADEPSEEDNGVIAKAKRALGLKKKKKNDDDANGDASTSTDNGDDNKEEKAADDEQANLGTIINLMSVDSFKIADITAYLHFLCAMAPIQLILAIVLLWQVMGLSSIPGLIVMVILLPVNYLFARGFAKTSKKILSATDKRMNVTNEVLQNIRIIKFFAWESRFSSIVDEKRAAELKALRSRYVLWACAVAVWNSVPILITFFSFLVYTVVEKKPLYPSVAFTAISLFMLLRIPLDQFGDMIAHVQETKVSLDRVEEFLTEAETEKYEQLGNDNVDEEGNKVLGFKEATFIWGGKNEVKEDGSMNFRLLDLNVKFEIGKLNIISGPTGSGKSSMLMALLGEMTLMEGRVFCPGGKSREEVHIDPATELADTIAYAAQTPWLVNASIKDNILFAAPLDEQRYKDVIVACALERDLDILEEGDETLVGEKGISLSGGQKQRISLARALYSNSQHILLDDCLSAVDSHTAKWIFHNCITGPLMRNRTCILVTHNVQLCAPAADFIVVLENGRVVAQGSATDVIGSGKLGEDVARTRPPSRETSRMPSRVPSSVGEESGETVVDNIGGVSAIKPDADKKNKKKKEKKKDAMDEKKAEGSVKWPVIGLYLRAMGPWWFWIVTLLVFSVQQMSTVVTNFWVREWSNQYQVEGGAGESGAIYASGFSLKRYEASTSGVSMSASSAHSAVASWVQKANSVTLLSMVAPEVDAVYYIAILALIGILGAVAAFIRDVWLFYGSLTASRKIHTDLMQSVSKAKFKFFDVTPLGQIMNRFSKDLEAVDQEIAPIAISVLSCALGIIITIIVISSITPLFLVAGVFITFAFWLVGALYLHASRDLKRLESVQRSPLFQQFGETLSGMTTIRAYGDERRFIRENLAKINAQSRPFIYLWACNRWLAFRCDMLGDLVAFFAGVFVILSLGNIDPGAAGISLSYAISFTENILWLVRLYAMNEQNMNSVERIKEYLDVEQEAEAIVEDNRPAKSWPNEGSVEFIDYTTRYRKELDPVLRNVSFKIEPRQKVGIVGRTGAGKSSLALAIFRALEAETGRILIDGIDIGGIGLQDLRQAITIVPQDPTLFMGTLRSNLDPFNAFTDDEIFNALRRVHLIGADTPPDTPATRSNLLLPDTPTIVGLEDDAEGTNGNTNNLVSGASTPTLTTNKNIFLDLSSSVTESGNNLSQGQRQLVCLARAMLRNPNVLVMDEATASIDYATDSKIQKTIRELTSTIITIAHRLQTIVDYDRVLVLDKGEVVEYGHPYELIQNEKGSFRSMCETSGEYDILVKAAKKAWQGGELISVDEDDQDKP